MALQYQSPIDYAGSIRVFGIAGLFGTIGYFRNKTLGRYKAFVTDPENAVKSSFGNGTKIVLSPEDPITFQQTIEDELRRNGLRSDKSVVDSDA